MFNPDEWLIQKFQIVSDWAHSQNEAISPYQIAAQLAGFVVITAMLKFMLLSTSLSTSVGFLDTLVMLSWSALTFATAKMQHRSWKSTGLACQLSIPGFLMRMLWLVMLLLSIYAVYAFGDKTYYLTELFQSLVVLSACYFMACKPPSPRFHSKQWQPIPVST